MDLGSSYLIVASCLYSRPRSAANEISCFDLQNFVTGQRKIAYGDNSGKASFYYCDIVRLIDPLGRILDCPRLEAF